MVHACDGEDDIDDDDDDVQTLTPDSILKFSCNKKINPILE